MEPRSFTAIEPISRLQSRVTGSRFSHLPGSSGSSGEALESGFQTGTFWLASILEVSDLVEEGSSSLAIAAPVCIVGLVDGPDER